MRRKCHPLGEMKSKEALVSISCSLKIPIGIKVPPGSAKLQLKNRTKQQFLLSFLAIALFRNR